VVLPLPGTDVQYPQNQLAQFYKTLMAKDGLDPHNMKQKHKDFSLKGAYRKILERPQDLQWQLVRYNDPTTDLLTNDYRTLTNQPPPQFSSEGKFKALLLSFSLNSSTYATMLFRELFKTSTEVFTHAQLGQEDKHVPAHQHNSKEDTLAQKAEKEEREIQ